MIVDLNQMKSREDTFISTFIYTYSKVSPPSGERPSVFLPFFILMSFDLSGERPFVSLMFFLLSLLLGLYTTVKRPIDIVLFIFILIILILIPP